MKMSIQMPRRLLLLAFLITCNNLYSQTIDFIQISPDLTPATNTSFLDDVYYSAMDFGDCDGDGDQDLIVCGNAFGVLITKLYINDGSGTFSEVMGTPFEGVWFGDVAFFDADGDTDLDVILSGSADTDVITKIYLNDGIGNYSELMGTSLLGVSRCSIGVEDVDGDADYDLVITGVNQSLYSSKLYINDGNANFADAWGVPFDDIYNGTVTFIDVDNDNDFDVLLTGRNTAVEFVSKLYINGGSGNFTLMTGTPFIGVLEGSVAAGDIDNDGDQDLVIVGMAPVPSFERTSTVYLNDGFGIFSEMTGASLEGVERGSVELFDADGDNDLEIILAGRDEFDNDILNIYSNDGTGFSLVPGQSLDGFSTGDIAVADIDNDTDIDFVFTGSNGTNGFAKMYRNVGHVGLFENDFQNEYVVYPNPSDGPISIEFSEIQSNITVSLFSLDGKLLQNMSLSNVQILDMKIEQPPGIYLLEITNANGNRSNVRFVIE